MKLSYESGKKYTPAPAGMRLHCRAMSDPFDAPFDTDGDEAGDFWGGGAAAAAAVRVREEKKTPDGALSPTSSPAPPLPTLPRYPVAATRNRNCWSEPPVALFQVRGRDYLRNGRRKVQSGPYMAPARGCDLLLLHPHAGDDWDATHGGPGQGSMIHNRYGSVRQTSSWAVHVVTHQACFAFSDTDLAASWRDACGRNQPCPSTFSFPGASWCCTSRCPTSSRPS